MIKLLVIPIFWFFLKIILKSNARPRTENLISFLPSLFLIPLLPIVFSIFSMHYFSSFIELVFILAFYKTLNLFIKENDAFLNYIEEVLNYAVPFYSELDTILYLLTIIFSRVFSYLFKTIF